MVKSTESHILGEAHTPVKNTEGIREQQAKGEREKQVLGISR